MLAILILWIVVAIILVALIVLIVHGAKSSSPPPVPTPCGSGDVPDISDVPCCTFNGEATTLRSVSLWGAAVLVAPYTTDWRDVCPIFCDTWDPTSHACTGSGQGSYAACVAAISPGKCPTPALPVAKAGALTFYAYAPRPNGYICNVACS